MKNQSLRIWDREKKILVEEAIYGDRWVRLIYEKPFGKLLWPILAGSPALSRFYGFLQDHPSSKKKIQRFIKEFGIQMQEYEEEEYSCFNDFFIRRFKEGMRPFPEDPSSFAAPCEGRFLFSNDCGEEVEFPLKGKLLSPVKLLADEGLAREFIGGPCAVARLCPTDYHRFHFPDAGKILKFYEIPGPLHSVNPLALRAYQEVLVRNERHVTVVETENFGKIAFVDVGALCVGKITQKKSEGEFFKKGDERGYFLFGGSTVVILGMPNAWRWDEDLIEQSQSGNETFVKLGTRIGQRASHTS